MKLTILAVATKHVALRFLQHENIFAKLQQAALSLQILVRTRLSISRDFMLVIMLNL